MAFDDASDPFQQVVYLQEGDAPPERIILATNNVAYLYSSRQPSLEIRIVSISDYSVYKIYGFSQNDFVSDATYLRTEKVISESNGLVYVIAALAGFDSFGAEPSTYAIIKINTNNDLITIHEEEVLEYLNNERTISGCMFQGYLYICDHIKLIKFDPVNMYKIKTKTIPRLPVNTWEFEYLNYHEVFGDDISLYFHESRLGWGDNNREWKSTVYKVNPNNLSLTSDKVISKFGELYRFEFENPETQRNGNFMYKGNYYCTEKHDDLEFVRIISNNFVKELYFPDIDYWTSNTFQLSGNENGLFMLHCDEIASRQDIYKINENNGNVTLSYKYNRLPGQSADMIGNKILFGSCSQNNVLVDEYDVSTFTNVREESFPANKAYDMRKNGLTIFNRPDYYVE